MEVVYAGILRESIHQLDRVQRVLSAFTASLSDAERLQIIQETANAMDKHYTDLRLFNQENQLLSLRRARDAQEVAVVKKMYGL